MVGVELQKFGVARLVGVDISAEAAMAVERDRPGVYDDYHADGHVAHDPRSARPPDDWRFNCMLSVAALGFGDIPRARFRRGVQLGRERRLDRLQHQGDLPSTTATRAASRCLKNLILSEYLDIYHVERYRHRLSINGRPLYYFGVACRKAGAIPESMLEAKRSRRTAGRATTRRRGFSSACARRVAGSVSVRSRA